MNILHRTSYFYVRQSVLILRAVRYGAVVIVASGLAFYASTFTDEYHARQQRIDAQRKEVNNWKQVAAKKDKTADELRSRVANADKMISSCLNEGWYSSKAGGLVTCHGMKIANKTAPEPPIP